ncbi:MAG: hypothetical protein RRY22_01995 [Bacilli bacterium]
MNYKGSEEKQLNDLMSTIGSVFYEEILYPSYADSRDDYKDLKFFKKGYSVTLKVAMKNIEVEKEFKNKKLDLPCDLDESIITVKPVKPYSIKDYTVETKLVCGF